ncbi:MAG: hypothetical protein RMY34_22995 [Aulosira sp. DedQUE10]|nr:hypothetical protein [Aulosira sp. DedQUE10]
MSEQLSLIIFRRLEFVRQLLQVVKPAHWLGYQIKAVFAGY